jgi:hypothetical protein
MKAKRRESYTRNDTDLMGRTGLVCDDDTDFLGKEAQRRSFDGKNRTCCDDDTDFLGKEAQRRSDSSVTERSRVSTSGSVTQRSPAENRISTKRLRDPVAARGEGIHGTTSS